MPEQQNGRTTYLVRGTEPELFVQPSSDATAEGFENTTNKDTSALAGILLLLRVERFCTAVIKARLQYLSAFSGLGAQIRGRAETISGSPRATRA